MTQAKLSIEEMKMANKVIQKCGCMCHQPGLIAMHMFACCAYSTKKLFNLPKEDNTNKK